MCPDPQLAGALGAALFARERLLGLTTKTIKVQYGYSDGTGDYFITIDTELCDGCGKCAEACPAGILVAQLGEQGLIKVKVKDEARKKLGFLCPGFEACRKANKMNCHSACLDNAISHSW
jgi:Fe-S-cluster-containing hydrogenase component 2